MIDCLLVYPSKNKSIKERSLPMGLLYLAGMLKKNNLSVKLVDERVEDLTEGDLLNSLVVGSTAMTGGQILDAIEVFKKAKAINPEIITVFGGIHPSMLPLQSIQNDFIDVVVKGEGEITLVELIQAIKEKTPLENAKVKGILFKLRKNFIIINPDREFMDLNDLPLPPFELIDLNKYNLENGAQVQTSRGCLNFCSFCYNQSYNKRSWRAKSAQKSFEEVKYALEKTGAKSVLFSDDNFFVNKNRVEEFCDLVIQNNLKFSWVGCCRMDYFKRFDDLFLQKLKRAGCRSMGIGVESGSQRVLDYLHKDATLEDYWVMVEKCKRNGLQVQGDFVIGFPTETKEELNETLKLIDDMRESGGAPVIFTFRPYPEVPLFKEVVEKYDWKAPQSLEEWGRKRMGDIEDYTWLNQQQKYKIQTIFAVSRMYFEPHDYRFNSLKEAFKSIIKVLLKTNAMIRWKLKFFVFGYEWWYLRKNYG